MSFAINVSGELQYIRQKSPNGGVETYTMINGKKEGLYVRVDDEWNLREDVFYKDDKREGDYTKYINGNIVFRATYKDGILVGPESILRALQEDKEQDDNYKTLIEALSKYKYVVLISKQLPMLDFLFEYDDYKKVNNTLMIRGKRLSKEKPELSVVVDYIKEVWAIVNGKYTIVWKA